MVKRKKALIKKQSLCKMLQTICIKILLHDFLMMREKGISSIFLSYERKHEYFTRGISIPE